ncbi:MAG: hypothetical protein ACRDK1_01355 [Solirubrobacterales bacterium]
MSKNLGRAPAAARIGTIAVAVMAAIGVTATALGATTAKNRVTVAAQSVGTATAECDSGRTAVAGGFSSPQFTPGDNGGGVVRLTSKLAGKQGVVTKGFNFSRAPSDLASFAYCVKHAHGLEIQRSKVFVGPDSPISAVATCRRGTKVVGGGFGTPGFGTDGGPRVLTLTSKRVGQRGWRVEAINLNDDGSSSGRPGTLLAYAYCESRPPKLVTESKRIEVMPRDAQTAQADCPSGATAYSGGFDGNLHLTSEASATGAVTSKRAGGGHSWRVRALDVSDSVPAHLTVYAYCRGG